MHSSFNFIVILLFLSSKLKRLRNLINEIVSIRTTSPKQVDTLRQDVEKLSDIYRTRDRNYCN